MNLRLFCALPTPSSVQDELAKASNSLRNTLAPLSASWVRSGNFHLTLCFLGDVEQSRVEELATQLRSACAGVAPFELTCQGLGCFPNLNRPRVIWAGLHDANAELAYLQNGVARACSPYMERHEKGAFNGHITLGRIRTIDDHVKRKLANEVEYARGQVFGIWEVGAIELLSSDLSQGAPRYSVVGRVALEG